MHQMKCTFVVLIYVEGSYFIYAFCIYLCILVSNTISISDEHMSSSPGFIEVRVIFSFCVVFCKSLFVCPFVLFLLDIVLFILLRFTPSHYSVNSIRKPFFIAVSLGLNDIFYRCVISVDALTNRLKYRRHFDRTFHDLEYSFKNFRKR